jgi:hypothetical protein
MSDTLSVTVTTEVPWSTITNCITGAIEGGSGYWCEVFAPSADCEIMVDRYRTSGLIWYDEVTYWAGGGKATLKFDPPTDDHPGEQTIGKDELAKGLNVMATKYPKHFGDLVQENDDAGTHDLFLQCVLFGEEVFA